MNRFVLRCAVVSLLPLVLSLASTSAFAQFGRRTPSTQSLQQYQMKQVQDSTGFTWGIDSNGAVMSYARAFSSAYQLVVNNNGISMRSQQSTPDGTRYRFTGQANQFPIVRDIKIDTQRGVVRYLDTISNPLPQTQVLNVRVMVQTRSSNYGAIKNTGQIVENRAYNGLVSKNEVGFLLRTRSSSYPTPVFFLCNSKTDVRPNITNSSSSNQSFQINYSVTIPAGKSATLMYGLAQRPRISSNPNPKQAAEYFKPFLSREFTRDIPSNIRRQIVNHKVRGTTEGSFGPLLESLTNLADNYDVERGPKSILVVGDESRVPGSVTDSEILVDTRLGQATLTMSQVAGLSGGGGVGRQPRVYLRSGEVLAGGVDLTDLKFSADNGLQFDLDIDHILALLSSAKKEDGRPAPVRTQWLQTQFGDQLELRADEKSIVNGSSMWGAVQVPLSAVKVLARSQEELPVHLLELQDGSRFWVILQGSALSVDSKTLGPLSVPVAVIDRLGSVEPPEVEEEEEKPTEAESTTTPGQPSEEKPAEGPSTQPKPTPPTPRVNLVPPDKLPEAFRDRMKTSLEAAVKRLAATEKQLEGSTDSAVVQQHFDTLFQVADMRARLGLYADSLKTIKKALAVKGLDERRQTRLPLLRGLEKAVSTEVAKAKTKPAEVAPEEKPTPPEPTPEEAAPEEKDEPASKNVQTLWQLTGDNIVAAQFENETVDFRASTGTTAIPTADILGFKRLDEKQGNVSFTIQMRDGSKVSGQFASAVLNLKFYGQSWRVPARHVVEFKETDGSEEEDE